MEERNFNKIQLFAIAILLGFSGAVAGKYLIPVERTEYIQKIKEVPIYKGEKIVYKNSDIEYDDAVAKCQDKIYEKSSRSFLPDESIRVRQLCHLQTLQAMGRDIPATPAPVAKPRPFQPADVCHGYPGTVKKIWETKSGNKSTTWLVLQPFQKDFDVECMLNGHWENDFDVGEKISIPAGGIAQ